MLLAPLLEIAKTPMFSKWMDEQILVYSYNVILLNNRKEQTTDILNNVGEPHRHYAESWTPPRSTYRNESMHVKSKSLKYPRVRNQISICLK